MRIIIVIVLLLVLSVGVGFLYGAKKDRSTRKGQEMYDLGKVAPVALPSQSVVTNEFGDVMIEDNKNFRITYYDREEKFDIAIFSSPFDEGKKEAEIRFLELLEINEGKACNLSVFVVTPSFANPREAGTSYPLSFCG